jgi:magnesium transporter
MAARVKESLPPTASLMGRASFAAGPVTVVEFDFANKLERSCTLEEGCAAMEAGRFVWIDVDASDPLEAQRIFAKLKIVDPQTIESALKNEPATQHARFEDYIHLVVSGCRQRGGKFDLERVDAVIAERFFLTIRKGSVAFMSAVWRDYRSDFVRFARSPSFLVYELWDHLIENYLSVQKVMEERVEELQRELSSGSVDDRVFARISELGADLLHFRKVLLPARSVLTDLSSRRSLFISEATQPFLANMVGTLEHVLQDLLVDRDILSESLNLYMSVVSHRTNAVMNRLTVVSVVFLPLTFLCGVYGMNFENLPELRWSHGYLFFWLMVLAIVAVLGVLLRRAKLL